MQAVAALLHARWVIPVEPEGVVLEQHSIAIDAGRIVELLPTDQARKKYRAATEHTFDQHAVIPGLINAHTHASMSLMRGIADDLHLMDWLQNHIWPAEAKHVSGRFVYEGTQLAMAEMLRGGTTCFNDMYFFPDEAARAVADAGMRASVSLIMIDFPSAWATGADEYLHKGLAVHDQYREHPLITTVFGPHAPYTVSNEPLEKMRTYAEELDLQIHMHVHETAFEVDDCVNRLGHRPLARLQQLGLVTPRLLAVHMTQLNDAEIVMLGASGAHVVHCPESNLKLASGFCKVHKLCCAGVNVALGTDGAASNNDLDMFSEMRTAALLAKTVANDASAIPAALALRMATLNGAKALGIDSVTGSLVAGKAADVTVVNLGDLETQPVYHPISQLVYATGRDKVTDVWVAGKHLLKDRVLTTIDERAVVAKAREWHEKMKPFE
jgi:5-methylthioadenosine/S-adenosylhomocysteine deaminase